MPCTDGGPSCGFTDHISLACHKEELEKVQDRLDYVTDMLCRVLTWGQKYACGPGNVIPLETKMLELHPGMPKWWSDHQTKDAKEKAIKNAEQVVQKAMAELKKLREE